MSTDLRKELLSAGAYGLASMIPLWRLQGGRRTALVVGAGVLGGVGTAVVMRREAEEPVEPATGAVVTGVAGVAIAGATVLGLKIDEALERGLVRRGVPAPRLVVGLVGAGLSLALDRVAPRPSATD